MIQAGRLSTPIVIQQPASGVDQIGQPLTGWTDFASTFASVLHLSGKESIKAGAVVSALGASIRIRPLAGVNAGMRVVADGRIYEIKVVVPNMQTRDSTDLVCEIVS